MNEFNKIKIRMAKYLTGNILDIGCGPIKSLENADTVDLLRDANYQLKDKDDIHKLHKIIEKKYDCIISSHLLEHLEHPDLAIQSWVDLLGPKGKLILYLPDASYYNNRPNPEHLQSFEYEVFIRWFKKVFPELEVLEHAADYGHDRYSFYLVVTKKD